MHEQSGRLRLPVEWSSAAARTLGMGHSFIAEVNIAYLPDELFDAAPGWPVEQNKQGESLLEYQPLGAGPGLMGYSTWP